LGNQLAPILLGSNPGLTLVEMAGVLELETTQSEPNGMVMLALTSIMSTLFVEA